MKKVIFLMLIAFVSLSFPLKAQVEKGKIFLAGSSNFGLNFGTQKDKYDGDVDESSKQKYFDFIFQPRAGYMFIDNLAAGLFMDLDLYSSKYEDGNGAEVKGATFILGPFARYYIPVCEKIIPYAEAQVGFGIDNYKDTYNSGGEWTKYNETVLSYRFGAGATFFINKTVGIDGFLGYSHESYKHKTDDGAASRSSSESVIYNEIQMQFGVVVMLDCKK